MTLSVVLNKPSNDDDDGGGNDEGSLVSISKGLRRVGSRVGSAMAMLQRRGSSNSSGNSGSGGGGGSSRGRGRRDTLTSICSYLLRETDMISLDRFKLDQVTTCLIVCLFMYFIRVIKSNIIPCVIVHFINQSIYQSNNQ